MKRKAKELQRQRQEANKYGRNASGYSGISGGGGNGGRQDIQIVESISVDNPKPSSYTAAAPSRSVIHSPYLITALLCVIQQSWLNLSYR